MTRLAASPQVIGAIQRLSATSPASDPVDQVQDFLANYQSKGLSAEAAAARTAADLAAGSSPSVSRRFELLSE
ncbi:MAG: hypothetical protein LW834_07130 [Cyanobium sp. 49614_E6]|nr:hypothetical protein [Cyanobium sp. 49614_E6]